MPRSLPLAALAGLATACGSPPSDVQPPLHAIEDGGAADAAPTPDAGADAGPADASAARPDAAPPAFCAEQANGARCEDGDACTVDDRCYDGACVAGAPVTCPAPDACHHAGRCSPDTGRCTYRPRSNGARCEDGSVCTERDQCVDGRCAPGEPVPDSTPPCSEGLCFTDVAEEAGLAPVAGFVGTTMGGGAGFLDYDGDGWLDLIYGNEGGPPRLYRNEADGTFAEVTALAGLPEEGSFGRFMGLAASDYDGDGDVDLYYLHRGANALYRNDGGTFTDVTEAAGVGDERWSTAAAFADFDGDGDLDLYVGNFIRRASFPDHEPFPNALYRNDDGVFVDVARELGVAGAGTTLAAAWSDFDGDGRLDLFVCNDFGSHVQPNRLYRNLGGRFEDVSATRGADLALYCMGIAPGDFDRDGDLDYYFANLGGNALLRNDGDAAFSNATAMTGVGGRFDACFRGLLSASWSVAFHDFDSDGWLDLYVSNGYVSSDSHLANARNARNAVYRHQGASLAFVDVSRSARADHDGIGRGAAFGDYDRDGDIDVLQIEIDGMPRLLRNDAPAPGHWLRLHLQGRGANRDAIGARVTVYAGGVTHLREVTGGGGYQSDSERTVHVGLGPASTATRIEIRWPSGVLQELTDIAANQELTLAEPSRRL